nr:hypothetical protein [Mycoplasmopsis bovis]
MIDSNDLYLFPTDVNKEVKTDFRDAYRWAYYEYHLFIQPMYVALSRGTKEALKKKHSERRIKALLWLYLREYKASW